MDLHKEDIKSRGAICDSSEAVAGFSLGKRAAMSFEKHRGSTTLDAVELLATTDEHKLTSSPEADQEDFPEGGRGWLVIAGCVCISFSTFGMINSYGAFQTFYETDLFADTASSKLAIIGACQASIIYCFTPLNLPLVYAFGIRNILAFGGLLIVISFFGLSTTQPGELWKCYFFQAVMFSVGSSFLFPPIMFSPIEWFKKRRAAALGMSMCGVSLGGMIWPIIFKNMINKYGFGWTTRTIGFVYIPLALGAALLIPQHLEDHYVHKPETISNSKFSRDKLRLLPKTYSTMLKGWITQTSDVRYDIMLISNLVGMFGSYPAIFYLDYFATLVSPGSTVTTYLLVIFNAMGGPGRVLPGLISDKIGRCNTLVVCLSIGGICTLAMWLSCIHSESISVFAVYVGIFGFCIGPLFSLYPACFAQVFGTKGAEARLGFFLFTSTPGPILGCLIAGSFIPIESSVDHKYLYNFDKLVLYSGIMVLACSAILLAVRLSITFKPFAFV